MATMHAMKFTLLCAALLACGETVPPAQPSTTAPQPSAAANASAAPTASATPRYVPYGRVTRDRFVGTLPRDMVQRVVRANLVTVKRCYATALRRDPSITGRFTARFIIDERGDVETAAPDPNTTTLADPELLNCITAVFKSLRFPQPEGGYVTVVYPLDLVPKDDGTVSPVKEP